MSIAQSHRVLLETEVSATQAIPASPHGSSFFGRILIAHNAILGRGLQQTKP